jgi:putative ABC transport system substrate-binding protein
MRTVIFRRGVLTLLAGAAAWPVAARAQQRALPVVGFLSSGSPRAFAKFIEAFREGLGEQGFVESQNVWIDYRWAEGHYNELGVLASELVRKQVNVIAATGGVVSAQAALKTTKTTPIVFVIGFDPVQLGLVKSINRPGGNATGASVFTTELSGKRLEMLYALAPVIKKVGILANPGSATTELEIKDTINAARRTGHEISVFRASNESEIDAAFASAAAQEVSGLLVSADPLFTTRRVQLVSLAARHGMPAVYPWREYVEAGGLLSYGTELTWAYRQIGVYAGRILKGAKPHDLPVVLPTKFELVINLKTAKALSLNISPKLLAIADVAIE